MTARVTTAFAQVVARGTGVRDTTSFAQVVAHGGAGGAPTPGYAELVITTYAPTPPLITIQRSPAAAQLTITTYAPEVVCSTVLWIITYPPDLNVTHFVNPAAALLEINTYAPEVDVCRVWIRELPEDEWPAVLGEWEIEA